MENVISALGGCEQAGSSHGCDAKCRKLYYCYYQVVSFFQLFVAAFFVYHRERKKNQ